MGSKRSRELKKIRGPDVLKVNRDNWSEESKRTHYYPEYYKKYTLRCVACRAPFGVTATDQRKWYEVWKVYIGGGPTRCSNCQHEYQELKMLEAGYPEKLRGKNTVDDLAAMLETMSRLKRYSTKHNAALFNRIVNELKKFT